MLLCTQLAISHRFAPKYGKWHRGCGCRKDTEGRSMLKKLVLSLLSVILFVTAACAADTRAS